MPQEEKETPPLDEAVARPPRERTRGTEIGIAAAVGDVLCRWTEQNLPHKVMGMMTDETTQVKPLAQHLAQSEQLLTAIYDCLSL